jgi:hypothetical protein
MRPDLPELPIIIDPGTGTQGIRVGLESRLPGMDGAEGGDMLLSKTREQEVAELMYAMKVAAEERKFAERRSAKIAKAKNRAQQKRAERR